MGFAFRAWKIVPLVQGVLNNVLYLILCEIIVCNVVQVVWVNYLRVNAVWIISYVYLNVVTAVGLCPAFALQPEFPLLFYPSWHIFKHRTTMTVKLFDDTSLIFQLLIVMVGKLKIISHLV